MQKLVYMPPSMRRQTASKRAYIHCCRYKNGTINGPVIGPWIGSTWHFNEALQTPRFEDYDMVYSKRNRFSYLGNGRTIGELTGADMTDYMREPGA